MVAGCGAPGAPLSTASNTPPPTVAPAATATLDPTATATVVPTPTATPLPGAVSANIINFANENLTIRVGTTVVWTNRGNAPHTATSGLFPTASRVWNSGNLNSGESFSFPFTQIGNFPYHCIYHGMTATVTVVP